MLANTQTDAAPPDAGQAQVETRPVRLLVPTERRTDFYSSADNTLRASDLGINRATTDDELAELVSHASAPTDWLLATFGTTQAALEWATQVRDAFRHPRDIAEARAWGFVIPQSENANEFKADRSKRLGWWWVYDPTRVETAAQRKARYLADKRLIDMRGFAAVILRSYATVKEDKSETDSVRDMLENPAHLAEQAAVYVEYDPALTVEQAAAKLLAKAKEDILKALPPRRDRVAQSDLWYVCDGINHGVDQRFLDNTWFEFNRRKSTGRPKGARTRNRTATA